MKRSFAALLIPVAVFATATEANAPKLNADQQKIVAGITANQLKGDLSFLSSDLLEGRATPSRGLDLAAEFIAAHFRAAGLEPLADGTYFQVADWPLRGDGPKTDKVRNVIGVLRGSDPKLKDTYIIISAHYDHLGVKKSGEGDLIYNGANDDGSGTTAVMDLAEALSKVKLRRSIVFMTYFGEELGDLGSRYYGQHPIFPIEKTIANLNLEQIGRTDDTEGPRVSELSMTGYDYTDMGPMLNKSTELVGVKVTMHPTSSDSYFNRSDNAAIAALGIPAHTLCTAFAYPDYHRVGDHWDKIPYDNFAKVTQAIGLAAFDMANSDKEPAWNPNKERAARYFQTWKDHHKGS